MTDEPMESVPEANPFLASARPPSPEVQAIPARPPGLAPRGASASAGDAVKEAVADAPTEMLPKQPSQIKMPAIQATPPAAAAPIPAPAIPVAPVKAESVQEPPRPVPPAFPPPSSSPLPPEPPGFREPGWPRFDAGPSLPADPAGLEPESHGSGRRRGVLIGASAAAAVAVAIGAISLAQGSPSSTTASSDGRSGAGIAPGAGDPTGSRDGGQPLDGSTSRAGGQDVNPGAASSDSSSSTAQGPNAPGSPASSSAGQPVGSASGPTSGPSTSAPPPAPSATPSAPPSTPPKPVTTPPSPVTSTSKPNMSCTGWHTTHVVAQDGSGYAATGTFTMRSGPYSACSGVGSFTSGQHMYIWCHTINGYGNTWVYGRIDGTSTPAWQSIANFKPGATLGPVC